MKEKSFTDIAGKLKGFRFEDKFDLVAGIANGGIVPAYMTAHYLKLPLEFLWINFRDDNNNPHHQSPILLRPVSFEFANKSILLVDDRANSGQTMNFAKSQLIGASLLKGFVINGKADYSLFDEDCFEEPWNI